MSFCKLLRAAVKDESQAQTEYRGLIKKSPPKEKAKIRGIARDEAGHSRTLIRLQLKYCGRRRR